MPSLYHFEQVKRPAIADLFTLVELTGARSNMIWALVNTVQPVPIAPAPLRSRAPARQRRLSEAQRRDVVAAYEAGASMAGLASEYGVRRQTISGLLRREGVSIRVRRAMSQAEIGDAMQLYDSGLSLQKIGDQLGWDHKTIYGQLKKHGVVMRGPNDYQHPDV